MIIINTVRRSGQSADKSTPHAVRYALLIQLRRIKRPHPDHCNLSCSVVVLGGATQTLPVTALPVKSRNRNDCSCCSRRMSLRCRDVISTSLDCYPSVALVLALTPAYRATCRPQLLKLRTPLRASPTLAYSHAGSLAGCLPSTDTRTRLRAALQPLWCPYRHHHSGASRPLGRRALLGTHSRARIYKEKLAQCNCWHHQQSQSLAWLTNTVG